MPESTTDESPERLSRALSAASSPEARASAARQIAAIETRAAFRRLVSEVVEDGPAEEGCRLALARAGTAAVPHIAQALAVNPDCAGLAACLSRGVDAAIAEPLIDVCRRTVNPWVVRHCAEALARSQPQKAHALYETVSERRSPVLGAAFHIGAIVAFPDRLVDEIKPYLAESAETQVQRLALTVREAVDLPEGKGCLTRMLDSGRVRDRCFALQAIRAAELSDFGGAVLDTFIADRSPSVHFAASKAMPHVASAVMAELPRRVDRYSRELMAAAQALSDRIAESEAIAGQVLPADLRPLRQAYQALGHTLVAAWLSGANCAQELVPALPAVTRATAVLAPLCEDEEAGEDARALAEELLQFRLRRLRDLWSAGYPDVRLMALELCGQCTVALQATLPPLPPATADLAWDQVVSRLEELSVQLVDCALPELSSRETPVTPSDRYPLLARYLMHRQMQNWALFGAQCSHAPKREALEALKASLERENRARSLAHRSLGEATVARLQTAFDDQPLVLLSPVLSTMAQLLESQDAPSCSGNAAAFAAVRAVLGEQTLQSALLGIISLDLSEDAAPALIRCLRSPSSLVAECAERQLTRLGNGVVPELARVAGKASSDLQRARLLEVCRCLEPGAALELAREFLVGPSAILCAVCAKIIGQAGDRSDVPRLGERLGKAGELSDVCILEALSSLDGSSQTEVFTGSLDSLYPGRRWAAYMALAKLPRSLLENRLAPLLRSDNFICKEAAEKLLSPDDKERQVRPRFGGAAFPAGGDVSLGARMAIEDDGPWEWGVVALMPDPHTDWDVYRDLVGSDEDLSRLWAAYSMSGDLPPALSLRLHEIAREGDERKALLAAGLLWSLHVPNYAGALEACLEYHGMTASDDDYTRAGELLLCVLRSSSPQDLLNQLEAPNPTHHNPLGEGALLRDDGQRGVLAEQCVFMRFVAELPAALGLSHAELPPESDVDLRRAAVENEWQRLLAFRDIGFGFWVSPRLRLSDLHWYCRLDGAASDVKHSIIDYMVCAATVLPQFREEREATIRCLLSLFRPLILKTVGRVGRAGDGSRQSDEVGWQVESEFCRAMQEYDAFWAEKSPGVLPLGMVSSGIDGPRGRSRPSFAGYDVASTHVPFAHYVEGRLNRLVRQEGTAARRSARNLAASDEARMAAERRHASQDATRRRAAIEDEASDGDAAAALLGATEALAHSDESVKTESIRIGDKLVNCYDIETVAGLLGTTVGALRQRGRRGQIPFLRHEGTRYLPAEQLADLAASLYNNQQLAQRFGVNERTIRRWKEQAPAGLRPAELLRHLSQLAEERERKAGRDMVS